MILGGVVENVLWLSLAVLAISAVTGRRALSGVGWALFGIHWIKQPSYYLQIEDYFNVLLTAAMTLFCVYMAWLILAKRCRSSSCRWISSAVAVAGILYFPFAEFEYLRMGLIGLTTELTVALLDSLGTPVSMNDMNTILLDGRSVEIILACTAIESIALFAGLILSVEAPAGRKAKALIVSVPVIYVLNLFRNAFVTVAYGYQWFGPDSFQVAHNVIAKVGSTAALFVIAYGVLIILPELLDMIDGLIKAISHPGGEVD